MSSERRHYALSNILILKGILAQTHSFVKVSGINPSNFTKNGYSLLDQGGLCSFCFLDKFQQGRELGVLGADFKIKMALVFFDN